MISPDIHDHVFSTKAHHLDSSNLFAFSVSSYYSSAFACSEYKGKSLDKSRYSFIEDSITNKYERPDISFVDDKLSELENSSKYEEQHVYSDAYEMAKDKYGCRELQKRIIENDPAVIKAIFDQIAPHLTELMEDQFGNYLFEKILKHSDKESLLKILRIVSPSIWKTATKKHGTRSVQKLLTAIHHYPELIKTFIAGLKSHILSLSSDLNGNHVVQKSLKLFDPVYTKIIFEEVTDNLIEIAMHRHGCCVLQRCIDSAPKSQLDIITNKIIGNAVVLVKDAFGNYVVQYVIALQNTDLNSKLALEFLTRIPELSSQKYSSNVIEKLLEINPSEIQQLIVQEISKPKNLEKMIFDQFANYGNFYLVVQRALNLAPAVLLKSMLSHIKTMLEKLKHSRYGRKICTRLIEDHPELSCK